MSSLVIRNAIWDKLTEWTETRVVDLENGRDPLDSSLDPWVSMQILISTEAPICLGEIGTRGWREEGEFQLIVGVPTFTGWAACYAYMDDLRSMFRLWKSPSLTIRSVAPARSIVGEGKTLGNWYLAVAAVSYYRDFEE